MSNSVQVYFGSQYPRCSAEIKKRDWTSSVYGTTQFIDKQIYDDFKLFARTSALFSKYSDAEGVFATLFVNGGKAAGKAWPMFSVWCAPKALGDAASEWSKVSLGAVWGGQPRSQVAFAKACKKTVSAVSLCFYAASVLAGWAVLESSRLCFYGDVFDTVDKAYDLKCSLFSALTSRAAVLNPDNRVQMFETEVRVADGIKKNYLLVNQNFNYHMLKAMKAACAIATFTLALVASYWKVQLVSQVALMVISFFGTLFGTTANFYEDVCMDIKPVNLHYEIPRLAASRR